MNTLSLLDSLRAYAAANPTDVHTVHGVIQDNAELEAMQALDRLALKWRRRQDAERRRLRAECKATVHTALVRTLRGVQAPSLEEQPFLLQRRITPGSAQGKPPASVQ